MKLSTATLDQIAHELVSRGLDFVLVAYDPAAEKVSIYSPPRIKGESDRAAAGLFKLVRDYVTLLDQQGLLDFEEKSPG
jgi:hypothetical protein